MRAIYGSNIDPTNFDMLRVCPEPPPDVLTENARDALLELARLLGRVTAEDAIDQSILDTSISLLQKKGDCDDKQQTGMICNAG